MCGVTLSGLPGKRAGVGEREEKEIKSRNRAGTQSRFKELPSKSPHLCKYQKLSQSSKDTSRAKASCFLEAAGACADNTLQTHEHKHH